ncbi:DUF1015 domain-containing protein [soil metagenome]
MAEVVPFHGLRYDESRTGPLAELICPPYDVISDADREDFHKRSENNVVRVEWGREEPGDDPTVNRYTRAKQALTEWVEEGVLRVDAVPAFYLYDHHFELRGQRLRRRGFLGALRLYQEGRGIVRPHELTFAKAKTDRLRLLRLTRTNTSPVFGMYEDDGARVASSLERWMAHGPARLVGDARAGPERHLLWALDDRPAAQRLAALMRDKRVYIADGHHRYETGLAYLAEERDAGRVELAEDSANFILAYLCALDDPGLRILPTHRIVRGGRVAMDAAIASGFESATIDRGTVDDTQPGIVLVRDGSFTELRVRADADLSKMPEAWRALPVAHTELLLESARAAGAEIGYEHDTERAISAAGNGQDVLLVPGVEPRTLQRVADEWQRLPQKTTYFYPKVPAGLVLRPLGE